MTRSPRSLHAPTPFLILGALAALCLAAPARAQSTPNSAAQDSTVDSTAQSAPAPHKKSRFGRFGRVIGKTASKVGISRKTAVRIAITAATGGAASTLTRATSTGTANALTRSAAAGAVDALTHAAAGAAPLPTLPAQSGGAEAAAQASQFLAAVALRSSQGDPDATRAMQALSAAMSPPDSQFVALQRRITAGDVSAAQELQLHEAEIVRKALAKHEP
ncbi:MAG TPA: hypothetical protein VFT57_12420 [Gemmatimonadaceae bacterium]|nr:hypothetical protein [Gemmatimonadaceae bacterium]